MLFHILFGIKQGNNNIVLWLFQVLLHTLFSLVFGLTTAYGTDRITSTYFIFSGFRSYHWPIALMEP